MENITNKTQIVNSSVLNEKKNSWFKEKLEAFRKWRERTSIKIDKWSRKGKIRRKYI